VRIVVPAPICATGARDETREGEGVGAVEGQAVVVGDAAADAPRSAAVAELQPPVRDRRAAQVTVVGGEDRCALADLRDRAGAARDEAGEGEGEGVGTVERQRAEIGNVAEDAAGGAAVAELQRAACDRRAADRAARVVAVAREH